MIIIENPEEFKKLITEIFREELNTLTISNRTELLPLSEELLNIKQLQLLLKVSKPTIFKLMKNKKLPYRRVGRRLLFLKTEILKSLKKA